MVRCHGYQKKAASRIVCYLLCMIPTATVVHGVLLCTTADSAADGGQIASFHIKPYL